MDAGIREAGRRLYVPRYTALQRLNHWITAILFVLLALSGLSMFNPWLFPLSALFGDASAAREIHPWLGCALVVSFLVLAAQFVGKNIPNIDDVRWARHFRSVMTNDHEGLPDLGKYNAGQKGVYWSQLFLILILLASGVVVWQRYFGGYFTVPTQRAALLIHSLAAALAIAIIIIHVYAGLWIKGTGRAMTRGSVTGGWAYLHHRRWFRETLARGDNERPVQLGTARHGDD